MTTFVEAVRGLGLATMSAGEHHHVSDGWVGLDCPRCSPGAGKFRLGYNLAGGYLHCWVCGGLPLLDTLAALAGTDAGRVKDVLRDVPRQAKTQRPRGTLALPAGLGPLDAPHADYLIGRGFNPLELRKLWKIKGTGMLSDVPWRIFIPVHRRGELVSWTARSLGDGRRDKYHNARPDQESYPMKHTLYGIDHCRHGVIVHEGPTDVWRTGPGAAGTLGVSYSREQLALLTRYPIRVVCFDNEPDAQRRAARLCEQLAPWEGETYRVELDSPDPGSATPRETRLLRKVIE